MLTLECSFTLSYYNPTLVMELDRIVVKLAAYKNTYTNDLRTFGETRIENVSARGRLIRSGITIRSEVIEINVRIRSYAFGN